MKKLDFTYGNESHVGLVREENQDFFGYFKTAIGEMFVVCDGMGGHRGGSIASQLAVNALGEFSSRSRIQEPEVFLERAVSYANKVIAGKGTSNPELSGMGTTCVVLLLQLEENDQARAWVAHVGDSRIYRIREKKLEQLTRDHSRVQQLVDGGIITEQEAVEHTDRNIITRALGIAESVEVEINPVDIVMGDRFILVSDGVHGMVPNGEFEILADAVDSQSCASDLISAANNHGGEDNSTAMVVDIIRKKSPPSGLLRNLRIPVIALAVVAVFFLVINYLSGLTGDEPVDPEAAAVVDSLLSDTSAVIGIQSDTVDIEFDETGMFEQLVLIKSEKPVEVFRLSADTISLYTLRVETGSSSVDFQLSGPDQEPDNLYTGNFRGKWKALEEGSYFITFECTASTPDQFSFVCQREDAPEEPEPVNISPPEGGSPSPGEETYGTVDTEEVEGTLGGRE